MTHFEYTQYLYDLFMKETDGQLHPAKNVINLLHKKGVLTCTFIERELDLMGVEYKRTTITDEHALKRATAYCLHSVATMMFRHHISFDEAMDPKYHKERWDLLKRNGVEESHKHQLLGMTKEELVGGGAL